MARPETPSKTALGERLRGVRRDAGDPDRDRFAATVGVSKNTIAFYERGERTPDATVLAAYRDRYGVDINWLVTGEPSPLTKADQLHSAGPPPFTSPNLVGLPRFDVQASAGIGLVPSSEAPDVVIAFDRQFLRDRGAAPEHCSVIETRGDSMQPTIPDGSLLVVDHSQTDVTGGAIYVIGVNDAVLVKRVRLRIDGSVELTSDNAAYAPEIINRDQLSDLRVIGKVVYYCRTP